MTPIKYPKTFHVPWSHPTKDDKMTTLTYLLGYFLDKEIVVTEKMDGENTTMYKNNIHARSLDSKNHPSRDWVKNLWASIKHNIPDDIRISGENLYAEHSIKYEDLESYFLVFNIFNKTSCLSWDDTLKISTELGLKTVPIIYRGKFNLTQLNDLASSLPNTKEGYVLRPTSSFLITEFASSVFKYVRKDHVQTDEHWINKPIIRNKLKQDESTIIKN